MKRNLLFLLNTLIFLFLLSIFSSCKTDEPQPDPVNIDVLPASLSFSAEGATANLAITSNTTWTLVDTCEWITTSAQSGDGSLTLSVTASENTKKIARNTILGLNINDETSVQIPVTQEAADEWGGFKFDTEPDSTGMRSIPSAELTKEIGAGWNLGNTLEAIGGETAWGNPMTTQKLIDSVKAAGFNFVRIPVAWSVFSDEVNYTIDEDWLNRVEEVVNYVLNDGMYAMINIHWDGGWMNNPTYDAQNTINSRLSIMWDQIANHFIDYGDHLLFAGSNEVHIENNYSAPTKENYTVQNSFNQTFIDAVRKTGGKNTYRYLVVQGYNTNIDYTVNYAVIPEDIVDNHILMEVHYYDPYNFTLNENTNVTQWGSIATDPAKTETWANESYADNQYNKMKTKFIDKGIGVILGEYAAISRTDVDGQEVFREYYIEYNTKSMVDRGLVPVYWDAGYTGNHGTGLFNRNTGEQVYPDIIRAIIKAFD